MEQINIIKQDWKTNPRWKGITRPYTAEDVVRLRGSLKIEHTLATRGSIKLWNMLQTEPFVRSLGALTGGQAMMQVKAGIKAIYLSGWQVAADGNTSCAMYPDQSLYPVDSVPRMVERINNSFQRADQIQWSSSFFLTEPLIDYYAPIIADAEAGFGGVLNAFELTKALIKSGASAVHFEDQLSSAKKCGHLGGKVLVPTKEAVDKLVAARLAADTMDVPLLIFARTDAEAADLITSDYDMNDKPFMIGHRTDDGFHITKKGLEQAISRGLAYAPYADVIWCETGKPDLEFAKKFADAIHMKFPGKLLAYNCSPSFNWKKNLSDDMIANFQEQLATMGYKYQFITLAGIHSMWYNMFDLAKDYNVRGMSAYVEKVQEPEFNERINGYTFVSHQQEVGTGYFDDVTTTIQGKTSSITAMKKSTESEQFH
jgi:isocitrate lyase